jgi:uncharacterized protein HemY
LGTLEHLELIHASQQKIDAAQELQVAAEDALQQLRDEGYIIDQDYKDLLALTNEFKDRYFKHKTELQRLSKLSWWDRLFNYKVYV